MVMNVWIRLSEVEPEARVYVINCMSMFMAVFEENQVCTYRGYAAEISLACMMNRWMYVYVCYCKYVKWD